MHQIIILKISAKAVKAESIFMPMLALLLAIQMSMAYKETPRIGLMMTNYLMAAMRQAWAHRWALKALKWLFSLSNK